MTYLTLSRSTTTNIREIDFFVEIISSISPSPTSLGSAKMETTMGVAEVLEGKPLLSGVLLKCSELFRVDPVSGMALG